MAHLIGITQGRLTKSKTLQHFPKDYRREFFFAKKTKLDFIELISEEKFNKKNPIWGERKKQYKILEKKYNLKLLYFCDNYVVANSINRIKTQNYLRSLIDNISVLRIKYLIIPLLGASNITLKNFKSYKKSLTKIYKYSLKNKIKLLIESNMAATTFLKIKKKFQLKYLLFLFDTGNRVCFYKNSYKDILSFNKSIGHVHLKDKIDNKNVKINSGNVNFYNVFEALKIINYKKNFTIESVRGSNPLITTQKNLKFFKNLISKN